MASPIRTSSSISITRYSSQEGRHDQARPPKRSAVQRREALSSDPIVRALRGQRKADRQGPRASGPARTDLRHHVRLRRRGGGGGGGGARRDGGLRRRRS